MVVIVFLGSFKGTKLIISFFLSIYLPFSPSFINFFHSHINELINQINSLIM